MSADGDRTCLALDDGQSLALPIPDGWVHLGTSTDVAAVVDGPADVIELLEAVARQEAIVTMVPRQQQVSPTLAFIAPVAGVDAVEARAQALARGADVVQSSDDLVIVRSEDVPGRTSYFISVVVEPKVVGLTVSLEGPSDVVADQLGTATRIAERATVVAGDCSTE